MSTVCVSNLSSNCFASLDRSIPMLSPLALTPCRRWRPFKAARSAQSTHSTSVTRFGEISPLCQKFQSLWAIFWMSYLVFGKLLSRLWHFYATGQIFIVVNGQRLHSNKAIWSHCPALNTKTLLLLFSQNVCLYSRNILLGTPQTTLQPVWPDWVKKVSQTLSDVLGYFENKPSLF